MSKNIILVAESGSDIPVDVAKRYGIHIVPMHVTFGDTTLEDGSFPIEDIYDYHKKTGRIPKTSACSPDDFMKTFDEIHSQHPEKDILYLAYSVATTASYQSAMLAAEGRDYKLTSIDTQQVSGGQAAIVIKIAEMLDKNPDLSLEEAVDAANDLIKKTHMCFLPDNLDFLRAGGRVSNVAYLGSRLLGIHPCIEIKNGLLTATKKYRGSLLKLAPRLIREYTKLYGFNKNRIYFLWSVGLGDDVKEVAEKEAKDCGFKEIVWLRTGCVITTHSGPGTFGLVGISLA